MAVVVSLTTANGVGDNIAYEAIELEIGNEREKWYENYVADEKLS